MQCLQIDGNNGCSDSDKPSSAFFHYQCPPEMFQRHRTNCPNLGGVTIRLVVYHVLTNHGGGICSFHLQFGIVIILWSAVLSQFSHLRASFLRASTNVFLSRKESSMLLLHVLAKMGLFHILVSLASLSMAAQTSGEQTPKYTSNYNLK